MYEGRGRGIGTYRWRHGDMWGEGGGECGSGELAHVGEGNWYMWGIGIGTCGGERLAHVGEGDGQDMLHARERMGTYGRRDEHMLVEGMGT
jgi:hypothetical protein